MQNGEEKNRIERLSGPLAPIWGVSFCPVKEDDSDIFVTVDWTQALSFYDTNGKQVISYTKILNFSMLSFIILFIKSNFTQLSENYLTNKKLIRILRTFFTCFFYLSKILTFKRS